jgi:type IV pilus assembly protein PilC
MATARKPRASTVKESTFTWEGKNKDGKIVRGEIRAASIAVVQTTLRRQGISNPSIKKVRFKMGGKVTEKDIALFTRQLATMMKAGVPLLQSFEIVGRGHDNPAVGKLLLNIKSDVETGSSLSQGFRKFPL